MSVITFGIVLQNQPAQKNDLKITLFSPHGLLVVFAKHGQSLNCEYREALQPLTLGLFSLYTSKTNTYYLQSAELKTFFPEIRQSYHQIQAAGKILRCVLRTQWKEKPSKDLFSLLFNFLYRLHLTENPSFFASMFSIKLLQYEGIFDISSRCAQCKQQVKLEVFRYEGRQFCEKHAPPAAILMQEEEEKVIRTIIQAKQFHELLQLSNFHFDLENKIDAIFNSNLQTMHSFS